MLSVNERELMKEFYSWGQIGTRLLQICRVECGHCLNVRRSPFIKQCLLSLENCLRKRPLLAGSLQLLSRHSHRPDNWGTLSILLTP